MITKYCNLLAQNALGLGTDTTYEKLLAENIKLKCVSTKGSTLRNKFTTIIETVKIFL